MNVDKITEENNAITESDKKVYTIGTDERIKLVIKGNYVVYENRSDFNEQVRLVCDLNNNKMLMYTKEYVDEYFKICDTNIEYNQFLDLSNKGDRWEGACLHGRPFGYGIMYDENNHVLYKGFNFEGIKVCYGEDYYEGSTMIEYRGCFLNGVRYGWGQSFDKEGHLLYEGHWPLNIKGIKVNIGDGCIEDSMIHNMIKELIIGNDCYNEVLVLMIRNYYELEKLKIGNNCFSNIMRFELNNCNKLIEMIIEERSFYGVSSLSLTS